MTGPPRSRPRPTVLAIAGIGALGLVVGAGSLGFEWLGGDGQAPAGPAPRFVDETEAAGVAFTYDGPFEYAVGAGLAVFDCNADGRPDLYLAGGEGAAGLFRNDSLRGGALRFIRVRSPVTDLTAVNGAYPLDVDSDGFTDLVTLRWGENVALRGLGDCRFERANEAWGLDGGGEMTEAFSATWERGESLPTLGFGNYLEPDNLDLDTRCQANELHRPAPSATTYRPPIPLTPAFCALSMLFSDWDGSGRRDLRISNDRAYYRQSVGQEQLWRIAPGAAPRLYTSEDGWARTQVEGMGIASYDLTGDGLPEVYLTSQAASKLQTLAEGPDRPTFRDIGLAYGVNVAHPFTGSDTHLPSTAWHPEFDDVNNDGRIDLFVSKGNVTAQPDFAMEDPSNLLLGRPDGTFLEVADVAGIVRYDRARGAALADLDLDGRLDLVLSAYGAPVRLWHNVGPAAGSDDGAANWIALRIRQPAPNVDAIGATLDVRAGATTWRRELTAGGGHASGELGWIHVGLGAASAAEVRITWPDGEVGPWQPVGVRAFAIVDREAGVRPWTP